MTRRLMAVLGAALLASACAGDGVGPAEPNVETTFAALAAQAYGALNVADAGSGPGLIERLGQLPPELALSATQTTAIRGLIEAFLAATAGDRAALAAVRAQALAARQAGKTAEEVQAILAAGAPTRTRLLEAERALHHAILAVLTPAQRAWLTGRTPPPPRTCALTDAQRVEISGLFAAFEQANAADIALVRSVHERARAAHQAGASRQAIAAILEEARQAMARLQAARGSLQASILAVLTPAQREAGCFR
jgi:Spy/CpxP family protein refolding chaperone